MTVQKSALLFAFAVLVAPENSIASESSSNWVCVGALDRLAAHVVILEGQVILVQDEFLLSARCDGDYVCGKTVAQEIGGSLEGDYYTLHFKVDWRSEDGGLSTKPFQLAGFYSEFKIEEGVVKDDASTEYLQMQLTCNAMPNLGSVQQPDE